MTAARREHLGAPEALGQARRGVGVQSIVERRQVVLLLLIHVLRQVSHQRLDAHGELRGASGEVLEFLELLLDLPQEA